MTAAQNPAVLILAGGRSTRMGTDKALAEIDGRTLLQRAVDFWRDTLPGAPIYISTGRSDHFSALPPGTIPVADRRHGFGPMCGLQAAFHETGAAVLAVSAVDMPLLTREAFALLQAAFTGAEDLCVFSRNSMPEPLFGLYSSSCLPLLDEMMEAGNYRMMQFVRSANANLVPLTEAAAAAVTNTNTPEELQQARSLLQK